MRPVLLHHDRPMGLFEVGRPAAQRLALVGEVGLPALERLVLPLGACLGNGRLEPGWLPVSHGGLPRRAPGRRPFRKARGEPASDPAAPREAHEGSAIDAELRQQLGGRSRRAGTAGRRQPRAPACGRGLADRARSRATRNRPPESARSRLRAGRSRRARPSRAARDRHDDPTRRSSLVVPLPDQPDALERQERVDRLQRARVRDDQVGQAARRDRLRLGAQLLADALDDPVHLAGEPVDEP